jgi:predicted transcriptional regulator
VVGVSTPGGKVAKVNAAKRHALSAALTGKAEASSTSLSASYGLPVPEVQRAMRSMGVIDNG